MEMIRNFFEYVKESVHMHIDTKRRIRDSVHDIVINLDYGKEISTIDLSKKLKNVYNIKISDKILNVMIFEQWWRKDDYSIFKDKDKKWLDIWPFKKTIERKNNKKDPPLGKSRRKLIKKEEDEKSWWHTQNRPVYQQHQTKTHQNNNIGTGFNFRDWF